MTNDMQGTVDEVVDAVETPGQILRNARSAAGLTIRQVADKLHLLPRQITALEQDVYQSFRGDIFCKGYIRAYGQLFDLDIDQLLAAHKMLSARYQQEQAQPSGSARHIQQPARGRSIPYWCFALSIALVIVLWLVYGGGENTAVDGLPPAQSAAPIAAAPVAQLAVNTVQLPSLTPTNPASNTAQDLATEVAAVPTAAAGQQTISRSERAETATMAGVTNDLSATLKPGADPLSKLALLSFTFSDDCWVQVKDSSDKVIFSDTKRAGDTLQLTGSAPFRVLLGNAPGVNLKYDGEPITISLSQNSNFAKFNVGQL